MSLDIGSNLVHVMVLLVIAICYTVLTLTGHDATGVLYLGGGYIGGVGAEKIPKAPASGG